MNKVTFKSLTKLTFGKPQTIVTRPFSTSVTELDPSKGVKWEDDPNAQTLIARVGRMPPLLIMGDPTKTTALTPYNPGWTDADAWAAFLTQAGVSVDSSNVGTVAATSATPSS